MKYIRSGPDGHMIFSNKPVSVYYMMINKARRIHMFTCFKQIGNSIILELYIKHHWLKISNMHTSI